jgi:hypothetical protein
MARDLLPRLRSVSFAARVDAAAESTAMPCGAMKRMGRYRSDIGRLDPA